MSNRYIKSGNIPTLGKRMVVVEKGPVLPVCTLVSTSPPEAANSATVAVYMLRKYEHLFKKQRGEDAEFLRYLLGVSKRKPLYFSAANKAIKLIKELKSE